MKPNRDLARWITWAVVAVAPATTAHAVSFTGVGFLPGRSQTDARGVSADGNVVVGAAQSPSDSSSTLEGFVWRRGFGIVGLGSLEPDTTSAANDVSRDGSVIVGGSAGLAFRWTAATGMVGISSGIPSSATEISGDGLVIVGNTQDVQGAFRWTASGGLVRLPAGTGLATSFDGSVVAGSVGGDAYRWTAASGVVPLEPPDGFGSVALAMSDDGSVIVGTSSPSLEPSPFRWTAAIGMVDLGSLGDVGLAFGGAVSADGELAFGKSDSRAFVWSSSSGMQDLRQVLATEFGLADELAGWTLFDVSDVSPDGLAMVGTGRNPEGQLEGWVAVVPEPSALALLVTGLGALIWTRR